LPTTAGAPDFDALSVWFSYPQTTPAMLARGEYGARVGVPRVLELLRRHGIPASAVQLLWRGESPDDIFRVAHAFALGPCS
jgi:hypothetical protein